MTPGPTARLVELGVVLPSPPTPKGTYSPVVVVGKSAFVSGQIVFEDGKVVAPGLVDHDVPFAVGQDLARRATIQALSALASALGSLDRIRQVVRVGVYVASSPGFVRQHEVANGATDLLVEVFGEMGRPARTSVGVASLPLNAPVEVELVVAVE
ncbi:MAG: RidA family protein [Thermoplasmata archaeon]|jgi:enamine deaminase RidA (YjgF/YER057c/UK114 family)|nr:RidA family protein [Thermoplasmata archaeon]